MSLSGPKVLGALDEALRDIRREEDDIVRKLGRSAERIAKMREAKGDLLRQFAAGRIDRSLEGQLGGQLTQAQAHAHAELADRTARMAAASERLHELDEQLAGANDERTAAVGEVDARQAELRGLSSRIATAIARDRDYEQQSQNLVQLRAVVTAARAKVRQADIDREQKSRAYRSDPLFTYLLERHYGTPDYRAGLLTGRLDGWVARLIDFETARRTYTMLNEWPAQMRAHAERQAAIAAETEHTIDEIERAAIDAAGGSAVRQALDDAQARVAAIDAALLALQDERDALLAADMALLDVPESGLDAALDALVRALGSPDLPALIGAIRPTHAAGDDPLMAQLDDARLRIIEEQTDALDLRARLKTLAERRRALEDIEYEFKALKFDDPRSIFRDDGLVAAGLDGFLTGAIEPRVYWESFRRSQAWSVGTSDWGGGVGLPRHGRQSTETLASQAEGFSRPRGAEQASA